VAPTTSLSSPSSTGSQVETAFAKAEDVDAYCFLEIDDLSNDKGKVVDFKRWGWTNKAEEEDYKGTLPMYAGAAHCDLCRGYYVGDVDYAYDSGTGILTVTYTVKAGFSLNNVHIHVDGQNMVPYVKGSPTVAPGSYGCGTHKQESCYVSVSTDYVFEAIITNVPATFYVIAHAEVSGSSLTFSNNAFSNDPVCLTGGNGKPDGGRGKGKGKVRGNRFPLKI
jgi:hypothetical protein